MRFAEVFLRLGCALVAWMVVFGYFLWLSVAGRVGCDADGDQLYRVLGVVAPLAAGISLLLNMTAPLIDVHRILRWLGLFPLLLVPFAAGTVWWAAKTAFIDGTAFCAADDPPVWQMLWPGIQVLCASVCLALMLRVWRRSVVVDLADP